MLENLFYLLLLIAGFPTGILLAKLCSDEIKTWRKRLFIISILSLAVAVAISFIPLAVFIYKFPTIISLFFIIITSLTIAWESH